MSTIRTSIERERQILRGDGEYDDVCETIELEVGYRYSRGCAATWGYDGGSPAEPAEFKIERVTDLATGDDVELTDRETEFIIDECMYDVQSRYESAMEDKAERQAEQREWNRDNPMD